MLTPVQNRIILIVLAVALAARVAQLDRGLWIDELATWNATQQPMADMFTARMEVGHLPLYFIFMRVWAQFVGPHAWLLRLSSVAFGMGSVLLTYFLGRGFWRRDARLLAAGILAVHAGALWSSQTIRPYELLALLSVISAWAFLNFEMHGGRLFLVTLFLTNLLGILTQAIFLLVIASQLLYLAWAHGRQIVQRQWPLLLTLTMAVSVAFPWYMKMAHTQKITGLVTPPMENGIPLFINMITGLVVGEHLFLDIGRWIHVPALAIAAVTICVMICLLRGSSLTGLALDDTLESDEIARRLIRYLVCWVGIWSVGVFLTLYISQFPHKGLRYYWPLLPGVSCLLAACVYALPRRSLRAVYLAALIATMVPVTVGWMLYRGDGLAQSIDYVEKRRAPAERIIGIKGSVVRFGYQFYKPEALGRFTPLNVARNLANTVKVLADQAPVGGTFWLIVYHPDKKSTALKAAGHKQFEILKRKKIEQATILHVKRKI